METLAIVGAVTGIVAIIGLVYLFVVSLSKLEKRITTLAEVDMPEKLNAVATDIGNLRADLNPLKEADVPRRLNELTAELGKLKEADLPQKLKLLAIKVDEVWESGVVQRLTELSAEFNRLWESNVPQKLGEVSTKLDTLWETHVKEAASRPPLDTMLLRGLYTWRLTSAGERVLPHETKREIEASAEENRGRPFQELVSLTTQRLGVERLSAIAEDEKLSLDDVMGLVTVYIQQCSEEGPKEQLREELEEKPKEGPKEELKEELEEGPEEAQDTSSPSDESQAIQDSP